MSFSLIEGIAIVCLSIYHPTNEPIHSSANTHVFYIVPDDPGLGLSLYVAVHSAMLDMQVEDIYFCNLLREIIWSKLG